jgi:hypothetical protein
VRAAFNEFMLSVFGAYRRFLDPVRAIITAPLYMEN